MKGDFLNSGDPLVSVIIAAYNAEQYLAEALDSVAAQTFQNFEVIVVDDGSTDRTADIVAGYSQVHCLHQPNRGQPAARNAGIRAARGKYIAFLDADDLWLPSKLEKQVNFLMSHADVDWIYSDAIVVDAENRTAICKVGERLTLHEGPILRELLLCSFIASPTPLIKREVFADAVLFDESPNAKIGEDWKMWLRIAERHPVAVIREALAVVRIHGQSMTQAVGAQAMYESKRRIIEDSVARNAESLHGVESRALSALATAGGLRELRMGRGHAARAMFMKAIRKQPLDLRTYAYLAAACLPPTLLTALGKYARRLRGKPRPRSAADLGSLLKGRDLA
jgi:GT2 family glycosyltransferase